MRFVETIPGKLGYLVKYTASHTFFDIIGYGPSNKIVPLCIHLRLYFFTHSATKQVSATETETRQCLRNLHDLFLVYHNTVGLLKDPLQRRVQIIRPLLAMLALNETWDVIHRARPIKRHNSNDVLETVRFQFFQHIPQTSTFQLEHTSRIRPA